MPKNMRNQQPLFFQTGGSHAAALFNQHCSLVDVQEDIGRHNALDKIIGAQLIRDQTINSLIRHCVVVSSRVSFEMVQKTIMAGIPVLIAVGAPSDLAISAAKRFDLTLIGFTSDKSFNVYHGDWRLSGEHNKG
jgi:FdhD protein